MPDKENDLREALSQLAQEETEQFAQSLTREERRNAEALFRQHKRRALSLIARHSRKAHGSAARWLRAAAALVLVLGGALLIFRQTPPEITPLAPGRTASVAPYHSDTPAPTETPISTEIPTPVPTDTPIPTPEPTPVPTLEPTATPPTLTPAPVWQDAAAPSAWQGSAFPSRLPGGYFADGLESENGVHTAVFSNGDDRIVFTESEALSSLPIADGADVTYVQWDGVVALRAQAGSQVQLTWDENGHSFSLLATGGQAEEIARSVKKVR